MAGSLEIATVIGSAAILPDNRRIDRLASMPVPYKGGFALVSDADGGNVTGGHFLCIDRLLAHIDGR